ncbi:unnamed protein product [Meganyctiphanes norvegica]|uniref:Uncharacterized protein n=1 Tax=Meganyctiphanes norvegica TaxID=48144 RepID=A0AAV2SDS4_MEGNR
MPDRRSNIPSYIFYGTIMSEIIRIARSILLLYDLFPRMGAFLKRMLNQGADSLSFDKFATRSEFIIEKISLEIDYIRYCLPRQDNEDCIVEKRAKQSSW